MGHFFLKDTNLGSGDDWMRSEVNLSNTLIVCMIIMQKHNKSVIFKRKKLMRAFINFRPSSHER